ncbi:phosphotransferase [Luteipulveratus flavus]|uniref:Phosphotransferase n=1 Tax=Luteipulveratus flavus TaxID=3031728 RepID=A0ABT6CAC5_9MICO|nr:phosphotransferase [Luteipulveratus sp. YIM 133296]MDF8265850.1 phosphotransferase [Luteipulveratus sp. YIM 133296]
MTQSAGLPGATRAGPATQVWASDRWRWEATRWIDAVLPRRGITRVPVSPRQPRIRPWSTQLVIDTDHGRAWFKAAVPEVAPEAAIHRLLGDVAPDLLAPQWAVDAERGWILGPDQGPQLRDVATPETITSLWSGVLRRYARLQRASVSVVDRLVDAGVPLLGPLDLVQAWVARGYGHERAADARLLAAAERLLKVGLPLTIEHGDLHAGNVFCADGSSTAAHNARFFDWDDAYVGNPLGSLLIALRGPGYHFGLPDDPERDDRLLRAYLSGWSDVFSTQDARRVAPDALLLARVARLIGWDRALARATEAERAQWQEHPDQWTAEILALTADG